MHNIYVYDKFQNVVHKQADKISIEDFLKIKDPDVYMALHKDDGLIVVSAPNREGISVRDTTPEQAIILLDAMLGLKEAARE